MVSTKIIVLAIVVLVCIIQVQGAPRVRRADVDGSSSGGAGGSDTILNNFGQVFSKFTKNPSDIIIIFTNFFKKGDSGAGSGASKP